MRKLIMVSGPSESGKSGGIIHVLQAFPRLVHIKIRDVFPEVYRQSGSGLSYEEWLDEAEKDLHALWTSFTEIVESGVQDDQTVIMDTMYGGLDDLQAISNILQGRFVLLYIDAPEQDRIQREYDRLKKDSPYSQRKGDPNVTWEQVCERVRQKDRNKRQCGIFDYPRIAITEGGHLCLDDSGSRFAVIINNDSSEQDFHQKLDDFIASLI